MDSTARRMVRDVSLIFRCVLPVAGASFAASENTPVCTTICGDGAPEAPNGVKPSAPEDDPEMLLPALHAGRVTMVRP